nr:PRA1 family protein G2 [Ipomoea batatas]
MVFSGQNNCPDGKMSSPSTTAANPVVNSSHSAAGAAATYTTIPIPASGVVQRSIQNFYAYFNRCRPWPEFLSTAAFDLPASTSDVWIRLRRNSNYFAVNYSILVSCCAAASLLGTPILLAVVVLLFALWLVLYFFREDPIVVFGRHIGDQLVIAALVIGSALILWITGVLNNLLFGVGVGISLSAIHGIFRNPEGLFLDEDDAVLNGLVSNSHDGGIS